MSARTLCVACLGIAATMATAQWWEDADLPGDVDGVTELYTDTLTNTLYCMGQIEMTDAYRYCFYWYHGGVWTMSDSMDLQAMTVRRYGDTLLVGGAFTQVGDQAYQHLVAYINGQPQPFGNFNGPVSALRILNGELYAVGAFSYVDGLWCGGVAKRMGGAWQHVGDFPANHYAYVADAILYQGNLVVTGTIYFDGVSYDHIVQFDGQNWVPLGQGIQTNMGGGATLAVYQGELYVGGIFKISEGNVGHCIMRWDGQTWHPVGTSVQDEYNGYNYAIGVRKLLVKDGLLFACGGFQYAGNVPAAFTATWDGDRWCGFGGSMDPNMGAITLGFYGDTLFVGCGTMADGQPVNHLVRYIGDTWGDSCSVSMGDIGMEVMDSDRPSRPSLTNLGGGMFRLDGPVSQGRMCVFNALGQLQCTIPVRASGTGTEPFSLQGLGTGYFVLDLEGAWRGSVVLVE